MMCGGFPHRAGRAGDSRREPVGCRRVGVQDAARHHVADRGHAGAGELGDVVLGVELVPRIARHRERERDQRGEAGERAHQRGPPPHPERIEPPQQHEPDDQKRGRDRDLHAEPREDLHQEGERVGVDHHQVDEVDRGEQDVVLELRQQDDRRDRGKRHRGGDHRARHQHQKKEIEQAPEQRERHRRDELALGRDQDRECREVQRNQRSDAQGGLARKALRSIETAGNGGDGGRHSLNKPRPDFVSCPRRAAVGVIKL